jgi:predicted GNAT family N-acyltransferase
LPSKAVRAILGARRGDQPLANICATTAPDRAACIALRPEVFVAEQSVPTELEIDEYEDAAPHFLARRHGAPVATANVSLADHLSAKIGRVAVARGARKQGIGAAVMRVVVMDPALAFSDRLVLDAQVEARVLPASWLW